ncbi:hypothetical protein DFJ74DRAFT_141163 [Hyaloraphidium curvatum]|nr:hypothetical protein DFJ74DRAFT_141163 [Hyaloraphidium curvatum]
MAQPLLATAPPPTNPVTVSPVEPYFLSALCFCIGALFSPMGVDLPAARTTWERLKGDDALLSRAVIYYHAGGYAPSWHGYVLQAVGVAAMLLLAADAFVYKAGFRTVADILSIVGLGAAGKQYYDYVAPALNTMYDPSSLAFARDPSSALVAEEREGVAEAVMMAAVGHTAMLGCLLMVLCVRIYTLAGGRMFVNWELKRLQARYDRAMGNWTPPNEIEALREELRREALQGDTMVVRPRDLKTGKLFTDEEILEGRAGNKAQGDMKAVLERQKKKEGAGEKEESAANGAAAEGAQEADGTDAAADPAGAEGTRRRRRN